MTTQKIYILWLIIVTNAHHTIAMNHLLIENPFTATKKCNLQLCLNTPLTPSDKDENNQEDLTPNSKEEKNDEKNYKETKSSSSDKDSSESYSESEEPTYRKKRKYRGACKDYIDVYEHSWVCQVCEEEFFEKGVQNARRHLLKHEIVIPKKYETYKKFSKVKECYVCPYKNCSVKPQINGKDLVSHIKKHHDETFNYKTYNPQRKTGCKRKRKHHDVGKKRKKRKRNI